MFLRSLGANASKHTGKKKVNINDGLCRSSIIIFVHCKHFSVDSNKSCGSSVMNADTLQ